MGGTSVIRKFQLVPAQESNPEPLLLLGKSGVLPPEPPVLCNMVNINMLKGKIIYIYLDMATTVETAWYIACFPLC